MAEEFKLLFLELGNISEQPPPDLYWPTIIPRIHRRLGERSSHAHHLVGDLIPVALSLGLILILVFLFHVPMDVSLQGLGDRLQRAQSDELQMIVDQQTVTGITDASFSTDEQNLQGTDDQISIMDILSEKQPVFSAGNEDMYIPVENLTDQEMKIIAASVDLSARN